MTYAEWLLTGAPYCHGQVAKAIRQGKLPHPVRAGLVCADCGGVAIEYDHRDYNKPLDVSPVCRSCNLRRGKAVVRCWSDPDEVLTRLRRMCQQPVVPWARQFCLDHIEFLVWSAEQATGGAVTRYQLRPDVFGEAPDKACAA